MPRAMSMGGMYHKQGRHESLICMHSTMGEAMLSNQWLCLGVASESCHNTLVIYKSSDHFLYNSVLNKPPILPQHSITL